MKGEVVSSYLQARLFPSLGISSSVAQSYIEALTQMDLKQFKKYFMVRCSNVQLSERILQADDIKAFHGI
jgi:hypothetical protein